MQEKGELTADVHPEQISLLELSIAWFRVGIQSFGGGAVSLELIRREFCEKKRCFTNKEFFRLWAICQFTPGVNQLSLAVLVGRELKGTIGAPVALVSFLAPSVTVTIILAWTYARIEGLKATQNTLRAVIPATAGLGLATAVRMLAPLVGRSSTRPLVLALVVLSVSAFGITLGAPVFVVLMVGGTVSAISAIVKERLRARENQ